MPIRRVFFDKTEVVCGFLAGKRYRTVNLSYDDIQRIQFSSIFERSFFRKIPSEQISVVTGKAPTPIVYKKSENKSYWDEYKRGFTKFAEQNSITFDNQIISEES